MLNRYQKTIFSFLVATLVTFAFTILNAESLTPEVSGTLEGYKVTAKNNKIKIGEDWYLITKSTGIFYCGTKVNQDTLSSQQGIQVNASFKDEEGTTLSKVYLLCD